MSRLQCLLCGHYQFAGKCRAFPNGIPGAIYSGEVEHNAPFLGDHGIQFAELRVSETVFDENEFSKIVRNDHELRDALEHYTLRNGETRKMTCNLVVQLPIKIRRQLEARSGDPSTSEDGS